MRVRFILLAVVLFLSLTRPTHTAPAEEVRNVLARGEQLLHQEGKSQEAIKAFTEAIRLDPRNAQAFLGRAKVYSSLNEAALAREDYDRTVQAAPASDQALLSRAVNHFFEVRFAEAVRDLDEAIRLKPERFESYHWRACAHASLNHIEQAIADFTQVIERDPEKTAYNGLDYANRANLQFNLGCFKEALTDYEQAEKAGHRDLMGRGDCLLALKRWPEALAVFNEFLQSLIESPPGDSAEQYAAFCGRATARVGLKGFTGAEADLEAAIGLKPGESRAYGSLAWARVLSNRPAEAQAAALKGLELDHAQDWIRLNLAHAYLLKGKTEPAKAIYLQDKDKAFGQGMTRAETALADFAEMRAAGIACPGMAHIETLLRKNPFSLPTSPPPVESPPPAPSRSP